MQLNFRVRRNEKHTYLSHRLTSSENRINVNIVNREGSGHKGWKRGGKREVHGLKSDSTPPSSTNKGICNGAVGVQLDHPMRICDARYYYMTAVSARECGLAGRDNGREPGIPKSSQLTKGILVPRAGGPGIL